MLNKKSFALEENLLIALFVLMLCLPCAGLLFHLDPTPSGENRLMAPLPELPRRLSDASTFPGRFFAYFNDNFGFRNSLVRLQATARVKWLGVSTNPQVVIGKDGWLFFAGAKAFEYYLGIEPFTDKDMARWQRLLEARRDWLRQRGIAYVVTVAPEKQTIYPEYMPDTVLRVRPDSRLDQLIKYLKEHSDLQILDLRPALLEAKARNRVYHRTNSHWNDLGALVAYRTITEEVGKSVQGVQPLPESDFETVVKYAPSGDLTGLLGLQGTILEEELNLRPRQPRRAVIRGEGVSGNTEVVGETMTSEVADARLPRMVMYRDSFSSALIPFLAEHFSRATYVWKHQFDPSRIEAEHPDVVLDEMVERLLMLDLPEDPPEIAGATAGK